MFLTIYFLGLFFQAFTISETYYFIINFLFSKLSLRLSWDKFSYKLFLWDSRSRKDNYLRQEMRKKRNKDTLPTSTWQQNTQKLRTEPTAKLHSKEKVWQLVIHPEYVTLGKGTKPSYRKSNFIAVLKFNVHRSYRIRGICFGQETKNNRKPKLYTIAELIISLSKKLHSSCQVRQGSLHKYQQSNTDLHKPQDF